jgi:hypothetical protein
VGFYAAEDHTSAGELFEGVVEIRGAAAAKAGLIDRVRVGQQLGYLGDGRAERFRALLAPEDWDVEDSGGFDEDLTSLEGEESVEAVVPLRFIYGQEGYVICLELHPKVCERHFAGAVVA